MRDSIYDAALKLFASHGYGATGLREIARAVNINPGSIYYHIESKQILLFDLVESTLVDLITDSKRKMKAKGTREEKLIAFVKCFLEFAEREPSRMKLLMREVVHLTCEQTQHVNVLNHSYASLLDPLVPRQRSHRHAPAKSLTPHTQVIISLLFGYLHCRFTEQVAGSDSMTIVRHIADMSRAPAEIE